MLKPAPLTQPPAEGSLHFLSLRNADDETLALALQSQRVGALAEFYRRYGEQTRKLLVRVLGPDPEIAELVQEVFLAAYQSVGQLKSAQALRPWLMRIAVFHARQLIKKRTRTRFFMRAFSSSEATRMVQVFDPTLSEAVKCTYEALEALPTKHRLAFSLRFIEGMELADVASACGVSLATAKRHLDKAIRAFVRLARQNPVLIEWLKAGRWSEQ